MVIDLAQDIRSLTEFKRHSAEFLERMKDTGAPVVLTVNGRAEVVVQDVAAYQRLLEAVDRLEAIEGISKELDAFARGEGIPAAEALVEIEQADLHSIRRPLEE